jgi:hypothetical protein
MIARFFTALLAKFAAVLAWFGELFQAVFTALWDVLRDAACWPFEQLLSIVVSAMGALDVSGVSGALGIFHQIPAGVLEVMAALGAGTCFSIVSAAIVIRLVLQLIPFVRLGS